MEGIVVKSTGSWYEVLIDRSTRIKARLRGKFKIKDLNVTNPIAVGDKVLCQLELGEEGTYVIHEIFPRENYIIRKSVHKAKQGHLIAANIDQMALIVTLYQPRTSLGFIDRFLVSAEAFRIPAIIVFNKVDLYNEEELETLNKLSILYTSLGYQCVVTSVVQDIGITELKLKIADKITLFSGHSGVGKSSLLNLIDVRLDLRTAEVSTFADKGVHTTTFAEMFTTAKDTYVIDTPGIKELGIFEIGQEELAHYFPEMLALMGDCKFNNCRHINEPGCAVISALKQGSLSPTRYQSYISMLNNEDNYR
ncbi:MAG: ribosome small subunit-dependent GTPase A [Cytophagales bacterium]|nr:MAG: ribosome small subunit-dependent GTPase A [Cytophagales bacterium]